MDTKCGQERAKKISPNCLQNCGIAPSKRAISTVDFVKLHGLFLFNFEAIPSRKIVPALPLEATSSTRIPASETPLRTELYKCFTEALKPTETKVTKPRKKINVMHYGECLTNDEVIEQQRKRKKQAC